MSNVIEKLNINTVNTSHFNNFYLSMNHRLMLKQLEKDKVESIPKETQYVFDELFNFLELDKKNITSFYYKHHKPKNYGQGRFIISYPQEINKIRTFYFNDKLMKELMFLSTNINKVFTNKSYELRKAISF